MFNFKQFVFLFTLTNITLPVFSQWNTDVSLNTPVVVTSNDQQDFKATERTAGGLAAVWVDYRNDPANGAIYIQALDSGGMPMWTANGIEICGTAGIHHSVPDIEPDNSGGYFIVWQDWRSGNKDIYAQRVNAAGNLLWTSCGLPVANGTNPQQSPVLVSDGASGLFIIFQDSSAGNWDIKAQYLDGNGAMQWATGGVSVCGSIGDQINPKAARDGAGGFFAVWQDDRTGSGYDIYAQRMNNSGAAIWAMNGVSVCNLPQTQNNPKIKNDGATGCYIAWPDKRTGTDYDVFAQKLDASGTASWASNGVNVCSATGNQTAIDLARTFDNGIGISWKDGRNGTDNDVYTQKLDATGIAQWTANGVALSNASAEQINPDIQTDGSGGLVVCWQDSSVGSWNVFAQRVNSGGTVSWSTNGIIVANATGSQTSPKGIPDGTGGYLFIFQDKRAGNFDLYAQRISSNGNPLTMDKNSEMNFVISIFPNPSSGKFSLISTHEISEVFVYDIAGRQVQTTIFLEGPQKAILNIIGENGIYLVKTVFLNQETTISKVCNFKP